MARIDLNADLGEGVGDDAALLGIVTSANVACGGHAGDDASMRATCAAAVAAGVRVGAHPSYPDRAGFGRRSMPIAPAALRSALHEQVGALVAAAAAVGATVAHCKPHGALYNGASQDAALAALVAEVAAAHRLTLMGRAGGATEAAAAAAGIAHEAEGFLDRGYLPTGALVPRSEAGAHVTDGHGERAVRMALDGVVLAVDGAAVPIAATTLCVHGDDPDAVTIARSVRIALERAHVAVVAP